MTIFGIPVRIEPSFLFITALVGLQGGGGVVGMVSWMLAVFISVLVHELGHATLMKYWGFSPYIVLHGFGGYAAQDGNGRSSIWRQVAISLAGPGAGFVLGFVTMFAWYVAPEALPGGIQSLLRYIMYTTFFWGVMNLLPMMPLDGGHVARLLFLRFIPSRPRLPWYLTIVVATLSIGASLAVGMFFWAIVSASAIWSAVQQVRALPATVGVSPRRARPAGQAVAFRGRGEGPATVGGGAKGGPTHTPDDDPVQAARAAFVRSPTESSGTALVTAFVAERRYSALAAIAGGPDGAVIPGVALGVAAAAALEAGVPKSAVELGALAHRRGAGLQVSPLLARAHGRLGEHEQAASWIQAAVADGLPDPEALRRAPELAALADDPRWHTWLPGG